MAISGPPSPKLAPPPDFRYVGLVPGPRASVPLWASVLGAGATAFAGVQSGFGSRGMILTAIGATCAALAVRRVGGPRTPAGWGARAVPMAIVPWGVLLDPDDKPRVLRWPAIKSVQLDMIHGRDQATPTTLWSIVTLATERERFVARSQGAVSIDRLLVHLEAYAEEASHVIALDLDGAERGEGPLEPDVEPLLGAARAYAKSARATTRLDLPPSSYRESGSRTVGAEAIEALRAVLGDRTPRPVDPRAFAAVLAAELGARELVDDLTTLVQSPHPVIAAVAKVAASKLGAATARVGALDEVAPFLSVADLDALKGWAREGVGECVAEGARSRS